MIYNPDDAPVTYLNKGQTYSLSVTDLEPPPLTNELVKYRTSIRISFEEEEQASKAAACWDLWKNTRGHVSHRKDGNLRAVELVDLDEGNKGRIQLERTSLDGFSVIWHADSTTGTLSCSMGVRFNFLSTDFNHSKGVKGVPLRLCAKTDTVIPGAFELSFCNVKLFRDHGAERKMFTDVSQLKRAIDKRKEQFASTANPSDNLGKRKRGSRSVVDTSDNSLDAEVSMMQSIFSSNRPVSNFCLPGEKKDDPDLFPIHMVDEAQNPNQVEKPTLQTLTPPSTLSSTSRTLSHSSADHQSRESHLKPERSEWNDLSGSLIPSCRSGRDIFGYATTAPSISAVPVGSTEIAKSMDVNSTSTVPGKLLFKPDNEHILTRT